MTHPPCFASEAQWLKWTLASRMYKAAVNSPTATNYCADCMPTYKAQMVKEGRCRYPATVFVMADGLVDGVRRLREKGVRVRTAPVKEERVQKGRPPSTEKAITGLLQDGRMRSGAQMAVDLRIGTRTINSTLWKMQKEGSVIKTQGVTKGAMWMLTGQS